MHGYASGVHIKAARCSVGGGGSNNNDDDEEEDDSDLRALLADSQPEVHCQATDQPQDYRGTTSGQQQQQQQQCPQSSHHKTLRRLAETLRQAREGRFPGLPRNETELAAALLSWREQRQRQGWDDASYFARIRELWVSGSSGGLELRGVHMAAVRDVLGPGFARIEGVT